MMNDQGDNNFSIGREGMLLSDFDFYNNLQEQDNGIQVVDVHKYREDDKTIMNWEPPEKRSLYDCLHLDPYRDVRVKVHQLMVMIHNKYRGI